MATIKELQAQLAELQRQIAETTQREKADAIAQIKKIMEEQGLTMADIEGGGGKRGRPAGGGGLRAQRWPPSIGIQSAGKSGPDVALHRTGSRTRTGMIS